MCLDTSIIDNTFQKFKSSSNIFCWNIPLLGSLLLAFGSSWRCLLAKTCRCGTWTDRWHWLRYLGRWCLWFSTWNFHYRAFLHCQKCWVSHGNTWKNWNKYLCRKLNLKGLHDNKGATEATKKHISNGCQLPVFLALGRISPLYSHRCTAQPQGRIEQLCVCSSSSSCRAGCGLHKACQVWRYSQLRLTELSGTQTEDWIPALPKAWNYPLCSKNKCRQKKATEKKKLGSVWHWHSQSFPFCKQIILWQLGKFQTMLTETSLSDEHISPGISVGKVMYSVWQRPCSNHLQGTELH